jgi:YidC/Oxa1 family membrane protein insertase
VLAPSWGECSFIEASYGAELVEILLDAGHQIVLRLHPMTVRHHPQLAPQLATRFAGREFRVETDMREQASLHESELMIGDWSGAALEYGFGLERPVLFIDTPKKVNNPEFERIGIIAVEESIRDQIGAVVDPADLRAMLPQVNRLCADPAAFRERLREARERTVYNVGHSATVGATHVATLADRASARSSARTDR